MYVKNQIFCYYCFFACIARIEKVGKVKVLILEAKLETMLVYDLQV